MNDVLICVAGDPSPQLRAKFGDYPHMFASAFGVDSIRTVDARTEDVALETASATHIIVTGSAASVTEWAPWMSHLADAVLAAAARGSHVIGVCFGHQLLGEALGGRVRRNPRGREIGTCPVSLTEAGRQSPLFCGLATPLLVQQTHQDEVHVLPESACVLAENEATPVQAFSFGTRVFGVQFHPEMSASFLRALAHSREDALTAEGISISSLRFHETEFGTALLRNFCSLPPP